MTMRRQRLNTPLGELPGDWASQMPGVAGNTPLGTSAGQYGGMIIASQTPAGQSPGQLPGVSSAPPSTAPGEYKAASFSTIGFTADGTTPTLALLPQRMNRRYLFIQATNASLGVWVGFGAAPSGSVHDVYIPGGYGVYEPFVVPGNALFFYGAAGATAAIVEGV